MSRRRTTPGKRLGPLESEVMNVLWDAAAPLTVRETLDTLDGRDLAYTTVMTVLDNLHRKGWVERKLDGRAYRYRPRHSREEHVGQLMSEALSSAADQHAALARFVARMTPQEAAALRALLDQRDLDPPEPGRTASASDERTDR
ncbi:MAG TPA: BlaI/MecI/CopY family transcriptional regulator [Micromonosporaceae bacterium]